MDKAHIIAEIRRTAAANGGRALGKDTFFHETGIKQTDWYGKYWARWSDAVREAGYQPNEMQGAYSDEMLIEKMILLIRELGRFPVTGEIRLKSRSDDSFPSHNVFGRLGPKRQLIEKVIQYCKARPGYEDILAACASLEPRNLKSREDRDQKDEDFGFVYLIKSGGYYKIGRSNAVGRRERELAIQLPEKAATIHTIRTDDPAGIEAYWHNRFAPKRANGEWFKLDAADIKAFRRRKFM